MSTVPIRVGKDTRAELAEIQRQVWEEHRARISVDEVIKGMLADRRAALAADPKPVTP